jgi:hypothetical protein
MVIGSCRTEPVAAPSLHKALQHAELLLTILHTSKPCILEKERTIRFRNNFAKLMERIG